MYHQKWNITRKVTRKANQDSWDCFISQWEHDIHGWRTVAHKIMRHLNSAERDIARLNVISEDERKQHYK